MASLAEKQEQMRLRLHKGKKGKKSKDIVSEVLKNNPDIVVDDEDAFVVPDNPICPYCKVNKTKANKRTGFVSPCKTCKLLSTQLQKYGLTLHGYSSILTEQNGKCAICGEDLYKPNAKRPCVDHCHYSGHVRGILCHKCNTGIGMFEDSTEILASAIKYLSNNLIQRKWWYKEDFDEF